MNDQQKVGIVLSLDGGTTNTVGAAMNLIGSTPYNVLRDGFPSVFIFSKEEHRELYGKQCLNSKAALDNPEDVIRSIKTLIRKSPKAMDLVVTSGGNQFTLRDILKGLISCAISEMQKRIRQMPEIENPLIKGITVTVPVGTDSEKLTATDYNEFMKEIVANASGLKEDQVYIIEEPVAAAIGYLYKDSIHKEYAKQQKVMVFDLGGGTLDITIVEHDPFKRKYAVLAKEGDLSLGGNDFSAKLESFIIAKCGVDVNKFTPAERVRFKEAIEKCKHRLSEESESNIRFEYCGKTIREFISRDEFEKNTVDLLNRAKELAQKTVKNLDGGVTDLDMIVLVGGASQMPQIRRGLIESFPEFDESKILIDDPFAAIARGAAIYAQIVVDNGETGPKNVVLDSAAHTYGFDSNREGYDDTFIYNLVYKDTQYLEKISVISPTPFRATTNDQDKIVFNVYETDNKPEECDDGHWYPLGSHISNGMTVSVNVPNKYLGRAKEFLVNVEFCLNRDGILEMIITDMDGNRVGYCSQ